MNANLLLEGWKIRKRIESDGYLGCKFRVAESLPGSAGSARQCSIAVNGCGRK